MMVVGGRRKLEPRKNPFLFFLRHCEKPRSKVTQGPPALIGGDEQHLVFVATPRGSEVTPLIT